MATGRHPFHLCLFLCCFLLLIPGGSHSTAQTNIAVLYPEVSEPFFSVFQTIIRGIENQTGAVKLYALAEDADPVRLNGWLRQEQIDSVIALGRHGLLASQALEEPRRVTIGALPITPGGGAGISLSPDPAVLFQHLREVVPSVRRIHVVYTESNAWLMPIAEAAAQSRGLKFSPQRVSDLREAVHQYRTLLQNIRGTSEAIWLPLDNITANDDVILPMVLQAAWEKGLVVFSSKPPHAQRGALFSMYPDHFGMGQHLARMASSEKTGAQMPEVVPLANLQLAVNLRTAFHLGLRFTPRQQEKFDLVFPSR
jgi:putative tryptophan/tyrosine transport system substrate-binding protein